MPKKKKYRITVQFSSDVEGDDPSIAVANLMYGIRCTTWTENVCNLVVKENGEIKTENPTVESADVDVAPDVAPEPPQTAPSTESAVDLKDEIPF